MFVSFGEQIGFFFFLACFLSAIGYDRGALCEPPGAIGYNDDALFPGLPGENI